MIDQQQSHSLDTVRGMAAVVVVLAHAIQWFYCPLVGWGHPVAQVSSHLAHFAVLIFFALSGYVITHSLCENARQHGGHVNWRSFLSHRIARILPPSVAALVFALLVGAAIQILDLHGADGFRTDRDRWVERETVTMNPTNVLATLLLSNGVIPRTKAINLNPPTWSLSLEFWAYLLALIGALGLTGARSQLPRERLFGATWLMVLLLCLGYLVLRPLDLGQYFGCWIIGSICYFRPRFPRLANGILALVVATGLLCLLRCVNLREPWNLVMDNGAAGMWAVPVKAAILVMLISLLGWIPHMPLRHVFHALAPSSYTLYLFHYPVMILAFSLSHLAYLDWSPLTRATFVVLLVLGVVALSHRLARWLEHKSFWRSLISWTSCH